MEQQQQFRINIRRLWNDEEHSSSHHGNVGCDDGAGVGVVMRSNPSSLKLSFLHYCALCYCVHRLSFSSSPALPPPQAFYDLSVPSWWPIWHASNYVPPRHPSRPQLLVTRFLVSTGPSLKSWTQLFLSLIRESPTSVSNIVSLPLNLFNLSETSASFQCLDFQWPHLRPFQDKTTINYQNNKCSLPVLSFSYWTPSSKTHDGWIHSSSSWLLLDWENCTTITTVPLQKGSHGWATQFFLRLNTDPQPCLSILSKIITSLHYPPGAL